MRRIFGISALSIPVPVLNERELAEQLGGSKTPLREALSLPKHEDLVRILPRQAYVVTPITVRGVHECFDLRLILECAAVELAAARITDAELAQLEAESSCASVGQTGPSGYRFGPGMSPVGDIRAGVERDFPTRGRFPRRWLGVCFSK